MDTGNSISKRSKSLDFMFSASNFFQDCKTMKYQFVSVGGRRSHIIEPIILPSPFHITSETTELPQKLKACDGNYHLGLESEKWRK